MKKTIGIIGGSGFIGKNLTDFFLKLNYDIVVVSRTYSDLGKLAKITWIQADVSHTSKIIDGLKNCQTIIWLASSLVPSISNESLKDDYNLNVSPIIDFFENVNQLKELNKFIFLSSGGTIYGNTSENSPITEDHSKKPISSYGLTKIITENYIKFLTQKTGIQSFILRPSNVYGKYQNLSKPQGIIGFAFKAILQKTTLDLYDDGKVTRDFIFVTDLASAINKCINSELKPSTTSTYNIGSEIGYTIKEILNKIEIISQNSLAIIPKSSRNFDCNYNVLNIQKMKKNLDWEPKVSIDEGLENVWNWIKDHKYDQ